MLSVCPPPHLGPQLLSLLGLLHPSLFLTKNGRQAFRRSLLEQAGVGSQDEEKGGYEVGSILVGEAKELRRAGIRNRGRE